jgi:hypothetical protein
LKIPKGNQNPYIEEEQTTQWPEEEEQTTQWPKDRRTDNTMARRRRTDNTMARRRRTDNTMARRRRTDNTMADRTSTKGQRSTEHTHKTKDRVTRTPLKIGGELRCLGRVSSSCSISGTRRVNLVTNPVRLVSRNVYIGQRSL